MALGGIITRIRSQYDKLLAFLVLIGLLGSLLYLAFRVSTIRKTQEQFIVRINSIKPQHETAQAVDTKAYDDALVKIHAPGQLTVWTNAPLFVPETRVWCVDCRLPIPYAATNCTYCGKKQPEPKKPNPDLDADGILDVWEKQYGMNPRDPADARRDADGDGFTALEEFKADTDPTDPASSPDIIVKLAVKSISETKLRLRFDGKVRTGDNDYQFQINHDTGREHRTYFVRLNGEVGKTGFVVSNYVQRVVREQGPGGEQNVDRSVLTLVRARDGKSVPLVYQTPTPWTEATAVLALSSGNWEARVSTGEEFELRGNKYNVISIDSRSNTVVITRASDGKQFEITASAQGEEGKAE